MNILEIPMTPIAATGVFSWAWLMIAIPLLSAAILLLLGKLSDGWGHILGTLAPIASFVIGLVLFLKILAAPIGQRAVSVPLYELFSTGQWTINVGLLVDQLSILFVLLVTGVGSLIHIYSIGYMAHDDRRRRFFAYLNFFIAAMLILVLANNYLILFFGWEGVGLASYLLISFWQHKPAAAAAGKKAFIVNRVGDLGMIMAISTMLAFCGSSSFADVNLAADKLNPTLATLLGFFLLLAACGKSAQVPLQSWLLDAMEGPTPVSALIHAATMVTAGVYLVVRSNAVYAQTYVASLAVAIVGTITLLVGAWIGCAKDDIKKVLAGSTMSQIGYMMLAAGLGPIGAAFAIFHLITHGFFKANMFLGAGSVMHGTNNDVNMRNFGALSKVMPITFITFGIGYLAIIGFPFTSGFYSKDHIIEAAFKVSSTMGWLALIGAGITAFYMTRLMMMTFLGQKRWNADVHPHESPKIMTVPLIILAILSIVAGWFMNGWIQQWLEPVAGNHVEHTSLVHFSPIGLLALALVAVGVFLGWYFFKESPKEEPQTRNPIILIGRNAIYADQFNDAVIVKPTLGLAKTMSIFDKTVVDGAVMGSAKTVSWFSQILKKIQNGYIRTYALIMASGVILVAIVLIVGRLG